MRLDRRQRAQVVRSCAVHRRIHAIAFPADIEGFADDIRRIFQELGRAFSAESLAGECSPGIDVYETDDSLEVVADLPGVDTGSIRLLGKGDGLLIAGDKPARRTAGESSFHLVERGYGRFARVVRLDRPCNLSNARATLTHGELRISIPKIEDRRDRVIRISIT